MGRVFTIGSFALVHRFYPQALPAPGETVLSARFGSAGGGKGTTQAYAARHEGAKVEVIARVGDDPEGGLLMSQCAGFGIGTRFVARDKTRMTGRTTVIIGADGANQIVVYPGAQAAFCLQDFEAAQAYVKTCAIGGFQFEVAPDTVGRCLERTRALDVQTMLDPAPVPVFDRKMLRFVTYIKPNEYEASLLTGIEVRDAASAEKAGRALLAMGVERGAVITMGGAGALLVTRDMTRLFPAPDVTTVDTASAGDSFAGAFLAGIAAGRSPEEAIIGASVLAAAVVSRDGTLLNFYEECRADQARLLCEYLKKLDLDCESTEESPPMR